MRVSGSIGLFDGKMSVNKQLDLVSLLATYLVLLYLSLHVVF